MRRILRHLPVLLLLLHAAAPAAAQEPDPPGKATSGAEAQAGEGTAPGGQGQGERQPGRRGGRRGPRRAPIAVSAKFVHPVGSPTIENGVVLIRGERIVAVGKQGEIAIPENATVRDFPTGHVYPGLIDAETDAFTDPATQQSQLDPGLAIADDLDLRHNRDDALAAAGITTAYVSAPAGQGAIVRPTQAGFEVWEGRQHAAVQLRMTQGPVNTHALQRQQLLDAVRKTFTDLEQYEKAKKDRAEALTKYEKDFAEYLAYHEKNKGKTPATGEQPGGEGAPARTERPAGGAPGEGRRGRRGQGGGGGEALEEAFGLMLEALAQDPPPAPPGQEPQQGPPPPQGQVPPRRSDAGKPEGPPKRPTYPRPVPEDPAKEALLQVVAGELPLRIEAHRPDELRAALRLQAEAEVPVLVLEQAYGLRGMTGELAGTGAAVVLTDVLPRPLPKLYEDFAPCELPAALQAAGVPFAIASGAARRAPLLPLMAAVAIGHGLDADAALRAITLTPAEILGVQADTGSLAAGKLADLAVFDRPLFESDSRVLLVLGKGRTEFEAKGQ